MRHILFDGSALRSAAAKILGLGGRRHEPAAERFVDEKFRLAVEACPNGMVMTDSGGTIVLVNTEAERMFGYGRDELIGRSMETLVPKRLHEKYARHRASFARDPKTRHFGERHDLFGLRRDGTEFPIEVRLNPIRNHVGLLVLSVIVDISERTRIDRLKDEFVSTVSHELRTPLTSISGSLGLLVGGAAGKLPEPALRLITIAQNNSQRLVRLINDILDIEKIDSGQVVFHFRHLDARALVEQVIEANRGYADGFGVSARLDPESASCAAEVYADPDRLAQVVTNLLSNAIKFSPPGGEVCIALARRENMVRLSVRDHGPGIPPEFKSRVFEKFAQADASDARQKSGTGLGLSIVKQIVARLGGTAGFADAAAGGTVFHVDLPSWDQVADSAVDTDRGPHCARILLCEDDPAAAMALREALHRAGFGSDFAYSPDDAIARAQLQAYGAIVVDHELPDGDGIGLVRRLRKQPRSYKTPIVVMSVDGKAKKSDRDGAALDILEWIEKPVDADRLAEILDGAVVRDGGGRPHILHVDDDPDVLDLVSLTLGSFADVTSVASIEEARCALLTHRFDLAVLDITLGPASGLDLLPDLHDLAGAPIPVIIFSAHTSEAAQDPQVKARLNKSRASLDTLVAAVHDRLTLKATLAEEVG